mgnify:CR=1 FL=1
MGKYFLALVFSSYLVSIIQRMNIELLRPIVFLDLETTGLSLTQDRVVEIAMLKVSADGSRQMKRRLINPEKPIPAEVSAIHGITDEKVANEPKFSEIAPEVSKILEGADLAGFNSTRFDIPLLAEEMLRAGINFDMEGKKAVDVQVIFHKKELILIVMLMNYLLNLKFMLRVNLLEIILK